MDIGSVIADGTVYVGSSPDSGEPLFAAREDMPMLLTWHQAKLVLSPGLVFNNNADWRLPTENELNLLCEHKHQGAFRSTFNESDSESEGRYWSSSADTDYLGYAVAQQFQNGYQVWQRKSCKARVRPVRTGIPL